jgi:ABC-type nitrate/sulfonate/bicarbonate transport system permease component
MIARNHQKRQILALASLLVSLVAWGLLSELLVGFPTISGSLQAAHTLFSEDYLAEVFTSLLRYLPGTLVGVFFGGVLGMITGKVTAIDLLISPSLNFFRALPPVALAPFFILVFGINDLSRLFLISFGTFFPTWVSVTSGVRTQTPELLEVGVSLGFSKYRCFSEIIFPSSIPFWIAGARTSIAFGYIMLFIAEWMGSSSGIGYQLSLASSLSNAEFMVVGLAVLGTLGLLTDRLFQWVATISMPWAVRDFSHRPV